MNTCGVSSLACFTAAWMPSTVPLLAVPTAAAFSAVVPRRPAWVSKFPARSSKTYSVDMVSERMDLTLSLTVVLIIDLCPVGGIWRSGCSHSQQFDRSGGVAENIRYFLGHHLLHVLPQVLFKTQCDISPLDGAVHQHFLLQRQG